MCLADRPRTFDPDHAALPLSYEAIIFMGASTGFEPATAFWNVPRSGISQTPDKPIG
jgi:hypothetical protein